MRTQVEQHLLHLVRFKRHTLNHLNDIVNHKHFVVVVQCHQQQLNAREEVEDGVEEEVE